MTIEQMFLPISGREDSQFAPFVVDHYKKLCVCAFGCEIAPYFYNFVLFTVILHSAPHQTITFPHPFYTDIVVLRLYCLRYCVVDDLWSVGTSG